MESFILSSPLLFFVIVLLLMSIKQIDEYQRGVKFTLGKYTSTMEPGWRLVIPIFQKMMRVDTRIKAVDVPSQETMTKDNIPININAVIYYRVTDAAKAILEVESFMWATSQLAQTTMRNAVGEVTLDDLLQQRDQISQKIRQIVDEETDNWGLKIHNVELKDISLPENLKRTMAKQAEAEREKRAVIIKAEGERMAAENLVKAAQAMDKNPTSVHLRTLQAINDMSSDQSNTVIFAIPVEVMRTFMKK